MRELVGGEWSLVAGTAPHEGAFRAAARKLVGMLRRNGIEE